MQSCIPEVEQRPLTMSRIVSRVFFSLSSMDSRWERLLRWYNNSAYSDQTVLPSPDSDRLTRAERDGPWRWIEIEIIPKNTISQLEGINCSSCHWGSIKGGAQYCCYYCWYHLSFSGTRQRRTFDKIERLRHTDWGEIQFELVFRAVYRGPSETWVNSREF